MQPTDQPSAPPPLCPGDHARRLLAVVLPACVLATAVAITMEIEMLLGFFPACAVIGISLAVLAAPLGSRRVLAFAVSAPLAAAGCAAVIGLGELGPHDAYLPINAVWWLYTVVLLATAARPVSRVWRRRPTDHAIAKAKWRFSLWNALVAITVVSVVLAVVRVAGEAIVDAVVRLAGQGYSSFLGAALVVAALVGFAIANYRSHARRGVGLLRRTPAPDRNEDCGDA